MAAALPPRPWTVMPLDADTVRLAEDLLSSAQACRFGTVIVEVVTRYVVDVRDGKVMARTVKEILPRVTIEQLRPKDSVIE